jgi:hypothetical protein
MEDIIHQGLHNAGANGAPGLNRFMLSTQQLDALETPKAVGEALVGWYRRNGYPEIATISRAWFRSYGVIVE